MAINIRAVRLQALATNDPQDYVISDFGTVQAAIIIAGRAGSGSDVNDNDLSIGFWDPTPNTVMFSAWNIHGGTDDSEQGQDSSASNIVESRGALQAEVRNATIAAKTDGVTLTWAGSDASVRPFVIAILINGINGAKAGSVTPNDTENSSVVVSGLGITPKVVFGLQNRHNVGDAATARKQISFGFAHDTGSGIDQLCSIFWATWATTENCYVYNSNTRISLENAFPALETTQEITGMASGEFTTTSRGPNASGAINHDLGYLALDFDEDAAIFETVVPVTDVAWTPLTGGSFTPGAAIMISTFSPTINGGETDENAGFWGIYVATESEEFQLGLANEDAVATINTSGRTDTKFFIQNDVAGAPDADYSSPTFSSGQIQYAASGNPGSIASKVLGIAFEKAGGPTLMPASFSQQIVRF